MSIQALADSLGLSISTISRALNGYPDVSERTRERVRQAASSMNYQPHPVAHRLATGKTGAIALITSVRTDNYIDATHTALMSGAAEVLRAQKYFTVSVGIPTGDDEMPEFERFLSARIVDGVILARTRTDDARVSLLQQRGIPFITHGRTQTNTAHAWVDTDNVGAFEFATQALIERGHRRIAMINGPSHMTFAVLREQGFRKAIAQAGLAPADCPVHHAELSAQAGEQLTRRLLGADPAPSAIVCATDTLALGAMQAIKQARLRVGEDIAIVGYGNTEAGQYADPPLATIDHAIVDNGRHLAQLLLRVMAGEDATSLTQLEEPQLIVRSSLGPQRT